MGYFCAKLFFTKNHIDAISNNASIISIVNVGVISLISYFASKLDTPQHFIPPPHLANSRKSRNNCNRHKCLVLSLSVYTCGNTFLNCTTFCQINNNFVLPNILQVLLDFVLSFQNLSFFRSFYRDNFSKHSAAFFLVSKVFLSHIPSTLSENITV